MLSSASGFGWLKPQERTCGEIGEGGALTADLDGRLKMGNVLDS